MSIDPIQGLQGFSGYDFPGVTSPSPASQGKSFKDILATAIQDVDQLQHASDDKLQTLASGEETDIHGTMIALQEADISMRLLMSVRNKVVEAYQQIMNMSL